MGGIWQKRTENARFVYLSYLDSCRFCCEGRFISQTVQFYSSLRENANWMKEYHGSKSQLSTNQRRWKKDRGCDLFCLHNDNYTLKTSESSVNQVCMYHRYKDYAGVLVYLVCKFGSLTFTEQIYFTPGIVYAWTNWKPCGNLSNYAVAYMLGVFIKIVIIFVVLKSKTSCGWKHQCFQCERCN